MSRFAAPALVLIVLACGCSQPEVPTDPTAAALEHLRANNFDDAIRSASEAIQQSPKDAAAYLYRGRAYYYRGGMGDANRAIEDLSATIRLAPDASEGYYFRALVYRELGQTDLADTDDERAREHDHAAREVFDQLSDTTDPSTQIKLKPIDPSKLETETGPPKSAAEMFRESAAADANNNKFQTKPDPADAVGGSYSGAAESEIPTPLESDLNKQYRALLGQNTAGDETPMPVESSTKDAFGRPLERAAPQGALESPAYTASPLPSTEKGSRTESPARSTGTWNGTQIPQVQSPFSQRAPLGAPAGGMLPSTRSPFPQAPRGATGYVPPVSPFGGPGGQPSGAAAVSRPYSTPSSTVRPQNSAVRPLYPRDYTP